MTEPCRVTAELKCFYDQSEQYDFISDEFVKPYLDDVVADRITDCTDDYVIEAFAQLNDDDNNAWLNFADIKPVDDIRTELSLAQIEHLAHVANTLNRHMTDFLGQLLQDQAEQQARAALRDL